MAGLAAGIDEKWAFFNGYAVFDVLDGASSLAATITTFGFAARQIVPPFVVLGAADLRIDEAVDALVTDGCCRLLLTEAAGDLFGRPTAFEATEDHGTEHVIALQLRAGPSTGSGLLVGIGGFVA